MVLIGGQGKSVRVVHACGWRVRCGLKDATNQVVPIGVVCIGFKAIQLQQMMMGLHVGKHHAPLKADKGMLHGGLEPIRVFAHQPLLTVPDDPVRGWRSTRSAHRDLVALV
jgi:hypothetical protein